MRSILDEDVVAGFWVTETGAGAGGWLMMMKCLMDDGRDGGVHAAQVLSIRR